MMNNKLNTAALLVGALLFTGQALADCPGPFVSDAKRAYEKGKAAESEGRKVNALFNYRAAEGYVCEEVNPYEADAAKRAAVLGQELGAAAEKKGDFENAFRYYDAGGHFAAADRAFVQVIRAKADDPGQYQRALEHFRNREGSFASNNEAALKATGPYSPDPKLIDEVNAMPPRGVEREIQKEAAAFNEQYLRDVVQVSQSVSDDPTDADAIQRNISANQTFARKWKGDLVQDSLDHLRVLRQWGFATQDPQLEKTVATKVAQLIEMRASALRDKFYGAPKLLEEAMNYYRLMGSEYAQLEGKLAAVRSQAMKLGDESQGKQRLMLAVGYYEVADADEKAQALKDKMQQAYMQKMQPSIDKAREQAEAMQKAYSDPAKVEEMRRQAEAAGKAMKEQQAASKANNKKAAEDLEKELGL